MNLKNLIPRGTRVCFFLIYANAQTDNLYATDDMGQAPARTTLVPIDTHQSDSSDSRKNRRAFVRYARMLKSDSERDRSIALERLLHGNRDHAELPMHLADAVSHALAENRITESTYTMLRALTQFDHPSVAAAMLHWLDMAAETGELSRFEITLLETVGQIPKPELTTALVRMLGSPDYRVVILATEGLGQHANEESLSEITDLIEHAEFQRRFGFRWTVLENVYRFKTRAAIGFVVEQLPSLDGRLEASAVDFLTQTTGKDFSTDARKWAQWWENDRKHYRLGDFAEYDPNTDSRDSRLPRFFNNRIVAKRVVFVIDTSSSMVQEYGRRGKTRWDAVRDELITAVVALPHDVFFNIIAFDNHAKSWSPVSLPATAGNKARAIHAIKNVQMGQRTALFDALELAFRVDENAEAIYLLSDGMPSAGKVRDSAGILLMASQWNRFRKTQINTINVGFPNDLLIQLAKSHGGSHHQSR